jgi:Tol biopolymer transport system component
VKKISKKTMIYFFSICLVIALALVFFFKSDLFISLALGNKVDTPTTTDEKERKQLRENFPGRIIYDSRRGKNFGIYSILVDGTDEKKIIDTETNEMFPDPSPDGSKIVFAKSQSADRDSIAEIWMINTDGSNEEKIASNGNFPTFSADGREIYFERERTKIIALNLDDKSEREIFPNGDPDFKDYQYQVVKPRISKDGTLAFFTSDKDGRWNSFYADLTAKKSFKINRGCEPSPFEISKKAVWVTKKNVLERSAIGEVDLTTGKHSILHDGDAPRGHEYFPTLVGGDKFLLFSSCRRHEHSHESANYQVFVKDLSSGKSIRVTFDKYTNRWPKLLVAK